MASESIGYSKAARFKNLLRLLLGNRMSSTGIILLVFFGIIAVGAPVLTNSDPVNEVVAGQRAQPEWVMFFPEGDTLSRNLLWSTDPAFVKPETASEWQFSHATPPASVSLGKTYDPIETRPGIVGGGAGSLKISYQNTAGTPLTQVFSIQRTVNYPYKGPPGRYAATYSFLVNGLEGNETIAVDLILSQPTGSRFKVFSFTLYSGNNSKWIDNRSIDSGADEYRRAIGLQASTISPTEIAFPVPGEYSFVFQFSLLDNGNANPKQVTLNIDNLNMKLFGTAFGLLGTDAQGRDLLAQLIYGARISLIVGLAAALLGIAIGLFLGLVSGYIGGVLDEVVMRFTDMLLTIPGLPLILILIAVLSKQGSTLPIFIIVIGGLGWMGFARLVRSQVLSLRERPFIEAAKASGAGTGHVIVNHIFPNIVGLTYVNLALAVPGAILSEAALSFLGLYDPTTMSWGRILFNAQFENGLGQWAWVIPPGVSIALISLSFVMLGYALDDIFNPRLRRRR